MQADPKLILITLLVELGVAASFAGNPRPRERPSRSCFSIPIATGARPPASSR